MKYEPSLDGLRAVAISSVFVYHFSSVTLPGGWAGVDIFFVLSGYLITTILSNEIDGFGSIDLISFYRNRFLRLAPAFVCLLVFAAFRAFIAGNPDHRNAIVKSIAISSVYLMNWSRAFGWGPQDVLGHTWSLAMEEQFYILWPISLIFIYKKNKVYWIASAIAIVTLWRLYLVLSGADPERTYNGFDTHADALMIGCALAFVKPRDNLSKIAKKTAAIPMLVILIILTTLKLRTMKTQTIGLSLSAVSAAWLVLAALEDGWLKKGLSFRPLVYTGRISYGWYLWHYPMILMAQAHFPKRQALMIAALSYPVAMASFKFIEKPFLELKSRSRKPVLNTSPSSDPLS